MSVLAKPSSVTGRVEMHLLLCYLCQPLLISRCQAAECTFCPSSLSSRASPELCCEGSRLAGTICGQGHNQEKKKINWRTITKSQ